MENLTKYVMGVAAKSNVEKRQVGCVITLDGVTVAEGFNNIDMHAEEVAIIALEASDAQDKMGKLVAHVTHQPCPSCARALVRAGVREVVVVEAFMKFDGDKTRFDLVDGEFAINVLDDNLYLPHRVLEDVKKSLLLYQAELATISDVTNMAVGLYDNYYVLEERLATVLTFGARKYKPNNWRECVDTGRYLAAAHRHLNAVITGEDNDPETNLPHIDHFLCNIMFLHALGLRNG